MGVSSAFERTKRRSYPSQSARRRRLPNRSKRTRAGSPALFETIPLASRFSFRRYAKGCHGSPLLCPSTRGSSEICPRAGGPYSAECGRVDWTSSKASTDTTVLHLPSAVPPGESTRSACPGSHLTATWTDSVRLHVVRIRSVAGHAECVQPRPARRSDPDSMSGL